MSRSLLSISGYTGGILGGSINPLSTGFVNGANTPGFSAAGTATTNPNLMTAVMQDAGIGTALSGDAIVLAALHDPSAFIENRGALIKNYVTLATAFANDCVCVLVSGHNMAGVAAVPATAVVPLELSVANDLAKKIAITALRTIVTELDSIFDPVKERALNKLSKA